MFLFLGAMETRKLQVHRIFVVGRFHNFIFVETNVDSKYRPHISSVAGRNLDNKLLWKSEIGDKHFTNPEHPESRVFRFFVKSNFLSASASNYKINPYS